MDRLLRLFRLASSPVAVGLLIGFNLVPLAGVLLWGWNVHSLLILYWVENGIIGAFAIGRILRAEGPIEVAGVRLKLAGTTSPSKVMLVPFFVMHYGIFWAVHGIFVFTLPLFLAIPGLTEAPALQGPRWDAIAFGAVGLAISHGASFFLNYLGRGEYRTASAAGQTMAPYGRVIVLHLTIVLGVIASLLLGGPVGAVAVLVATKTVVDLALHLAEHRKAAPPALFSPG